MSAPSQSSFKVKTVLQRDKQLSSLFTASSELDNYLSCFPRRDAYATKAGATGRRFREALPMIEVFPSAALALRPDRCNGFARHAKRGLATEGRMADQNPVSGGHPDMDYAEHEATFALFVRLLKAVAIVVVCILIFLAFMWG